MNVAGGIVALSIPFTAGVVAAATVPPGEGGWTFWWMSLCSSAVLAVVLPMACRPGDRRAVLLFAYFVLGVLSFSSSATGIGLASPFSGMSSLAGRALESLLALLDSITFRHEDTGPLVTALLTGQRSALKPQVTECFRASGASHILALSGLHLGVIYGILRKALSILGNSRAAAVTRSTAIIASTGFYVIMTGASPSIVRAFLFIVIGELSRLAGGRSRSGINVLCAALTIQLCVNPAVVRSVGFQLSYLAMLGIFTVYPKLEAFYPDSGKRNPVRMLWKSMALSLSCQIFTAPLVWHVFKSFPTYFLLSNLIALPLTEALMAASVLTVALSAAGCCPETIKGITDFLADALVSCLSVIADM